MWNRCTRHYVVSSTRLFGTHSQSKCKSSKRLENTRTGVKGGNARYFPYPYALLVELVLHLDPVSRFPETTERPGYFVGFADNIGDALTFKILKNDLPTVLHRSVVRSAADASHRHTQFSK